MIKGAFFDLDGVVFDTEPQYSRFWKAEGRRYHPEIPDLEKKIKGQTLTEIYDRYFADVAHEQPLITQRLNAFEQQMDFPFVPGLVDFVGDLRRNGVRTAVVTSSNRPKMAQVCRRHPDFGALFDAVLTSEDFAESKPSPDCYLRAAARFNLSPDQCVGLEDSFNGMRSVLSARMTLVALATTNPVEALEPYTRLILTDYLDVDYQWLARETFNRCYDK